MMTEGASELLISPRCALEQIKDAERLGQMLLLRNALEQWDGNSCIAAVPDATAHETQLVLDCMNRRKAGRCLLQKAVSIRNKQGVE